MALCRARAGYLWLVLFLGLVAMSAAKSSGAGPEPPAMTSPGAVPGACGNMTAAEIYARLKKETFAHNSYTATYFNSSERGKNHEIFARGKLTGKYLQNPAMMCEKRLTSETSFPEQAGVGTQECYSSQDDLVRILMPGAYRALGVMTMFPEDPKASYLNGENDKRTAVWTWFEGWDRMLEAGRLTAQCGQLKGKPAWVLIILRGKNPDPLYHHDEARVWVDPELWFPVRVEKYLPNDPSPVVIYQFEQLNLEVKLTARDISFEGVAPKWNLLSMPGGPRLNSLAQEEPNLQELPGITAEGFLSMLEQALESLNDYSAELTLELKYLRLRQYRQDRFLCLKAGPAFSSLTTHLETNYMLLNSGENFRTIYDPARDDKLHVLPAGIYRFMGEQVFPPDDPRLFSALGDNIIGLNFFALRDELKKWLDQAELERLGTAAYQGARGPWLEITIPNLGIPARPTVMRLLLDEKSHLPARLEYRGYDDPKACLAVSFANTRVNTGLKNQALWK